MKEKTQKQIGKEIKALEACKTFIPPRTMFGDDNIRKVDLQIEYLRGEIDVTAEEWNGYSDDEQSAILEARDWQEGQIKDSPSSGWESYRPKPAHKK